MCQDLCKLDSFEPISCPPYHSGKQVVVDTMFRKNVPVVVKARTIDIEAESENIVYWKDEDDEIRYPTKEEFTKMMQNHLTVNYNLSLPVNKGLYSLWPHALTKDSLTQYQNDWLLQTTMKHLWSLSLDPEYVFSRLFKDFDVFPEILGTCGGLYMVERVEPINMPYFLQHVDFDGWVQRVKLGLLILDLLEEFDNMFDSPVYLCDMKSEHFGLSEHGRLKYLDVDNVFLKTVADKSVGDGSFCETHSDCDLFDCKGFCDLIENKCTGGVSNNNLQIVCEKIFLGQSLNFKLLGSTGLLVSKHASRRLQEAVETCANPSKSETGSRIAADETMFKELKSSMKEIVSIHKDLQKSK